MHGYSVVTNPGRTLQGMLCCERESPSGSFPVSYTFRSTIARECGSGHWFGPRPILCLRHALGRLEFSNAARRPPYSSFHGGTAAGGVPRARPRSAAAGSNPRRSDCSALQQKHQQHHQKPAAAGGKKQSLRGQAWSMASRRASAVHTTSGCCALRRRASSPTPSALSVYAPPRPARTPALSERFPERPLSRPLFLMDDQRSH
jgi:hypothetical protein